MIIRIGDGQTASGKILDSKTEYYHYAKKGRYLADERQDAIEAAIRTGKNIWISASNRAYHKISLEELKNLK